MFSGRDPMWLIDILQKLKLACGAFGIPEGAAMWLFKQFQTSTVEVAVNGRVALAGSAKYFKRARRSPTQLLCSIFASVLSPMIT